MQPTFIEEIKPNIILSIGDNIINSNNNYEKKGTRNNKNINEKNNTQKLNSNTYRMKLDVYLKTNRIKTRKGGNA